MHVWRMLVVVGVWGSGTWVRWTTVFHRYLTLQNRFKHRARHVWHTLWSRIPGTPIYVRQRYLRRVRTELRQRMQHFRELDSLDSPTKQRLSSQVRAYESRLVMVDVRQTTIENFVLGPFLAWIVQLALFGIPLLMALLLLVAPSWLNMNPGQWPGWSDLYTPARSSAFILGIVGVHIILVSVLTLSIIFSVAVLNWVYQMVFPRYRNGPMILISVEFVTCLCLIYFINGFIHIPAYDSIGYPIVLSVSLGALLLHLLLLGMRPLQAAIHVTFRRRKKALYPDAMIVGGFLTLLRMIEQEPRRWGDATLRRSLVGELEDIATCLQDDLPHHLRGCDAVTDIWFAEMMAQASAAIRGWKRWVLTPKADTRQHLLDRLATSFVYAVEGQWDSFERATPEKLSRPQWWQVRGTLVLQGVQGILLSAIPLVLVWGVQQTPLALSGSIAEYVTAGAALWAAVGTLAALDPRYNDKIATIKTITDLLPLPVKQKTP